MENCILCLDSEVENRGLHVLSTAQADAESSAFIKNARSLYIETMLSGMWYDVYQQKMSQNAIKTGCPSDSSLFLNVSFFTVKSTGPPFY